MRPGVYQELLRLLAAIDTDGIGDIHDQTVYEDVCAEAEAFGRGMYINADDWRTIRRLARQSEPAYYDE